MIGSRDTVVSILTRKHNGKSAIMNRNQNNAEKKKRERENAVKSLGWGQLLEELEHASLQSLS